MAVPNLAWQPWRSLANASRVPNLTREGGITAAELTVLALAGFAAACAEAYIHWRLPGMHGHAILKAVLPMTVGFAFVPRHGAGIVMGVSAGFSALAITQFFGGGIRPAAGLSMLLIGPSLDIALASTERTQWVYVRFALAGAFANLTALAVKVSGSLSGYAPMGRSMGEFLPRALPTFLLCGAVAGLIGAIVLFRNRFVEPESPQS